MSIFHYEKKKQHENLLEKAIARQDFSQALFHAYQAAQYTFALARESSGKMRTAYLNNANALVDTVARLKQKMESASRRPAMADASMTNQQERKDSNTDDPVSLPDDVCLKPESLSVTLDDVSGMQEAKTEIMRKVIIPLQNPQKREKYGLPVGGGLLLYGLPGTGKTFFAKAVAGELKLPFYVIRNSDILRKWLGESEQIVKAIFNAARANPMSVIFIDETNGILPSRDNGDVHQVSKNIADIILQETDGIDSRERNPFLLIGATNYPNKLDDAALSRFSAQLEIPLPDAPTRRSILLRELHLMKISILDKAIDFLVRSTEGFSCRDLVNLSVTYRQISAEHDIAVFDENFCKKNFKADHTFSINIATEIEEFKKRIGK